MWNRVKRAPWLKNLTILYVNKRLKSKLDSLENIITEVDLSIMCLVETNLEATDQVEVGGYSLVLEKTILNTVVVSWWHLQIPSRTLPYR